MKKCKHCKGTDFGVLVKEIQKAPFRMTNGKPVGGPLAEPEKTTEVEVNYCFGCNKPITEDDLIENETCTVCGKEVEETINGRCAECDAQVKAYARMTKEELIMMMMKGQSPAINTVASQEGKSTVKEKSEGKKQEVSPTKVKEEQQVKEQVKTEVKEQVKEEVDKSAENNTPKEVNTEVKISKEEENVNLEMENKDIENLNDDLFPKEEIADIGSASSNLNPEEDILAQIDNIDVSSLNIISEDINEAI